MPSQKSEVPQVILPEFDVALLDRANQRLQLAQLCAINNDADYNACALELRADTAFERMSESMRKQMTGPINTALREINARLMPPGEIAGKARVIRSKLMGEYQATKLREQRRLQLAADQEAERQRKALELRAQKADASGKTDKAIALAQLASTTIAPVIRNDPPKVSGQSLREVWLFVIEDAALLPREYTTADEQKIRRYVNAMKADARIAGVRIYSEKRVASGV